MTRIVDVVIVGDHAAALAAAVNAVGQGQRVLLVIRRPHRDLGRQCRKAIAAASPCAPRQLTVVTGAEIACVDGVRSVEAVVIRRRRTGRLIAFNAAALLNLDEIPH